MQPIDSTDQVTPTQEGMMEFRQLKTFRTLADNLNFTRTAQQLFMAQSSVSAQIKALEESLGARLFDRIGRRVILTDAGSKLYEYARRMEEMTAEIRSEITDKKQLEGSLTIRVPETIASVYMPEIIRVFHHDNPNVRLRLINCTDRQLKEELNTGRIDLAFLMTDAIHFKDVNVRFLKTESLILAGGRQQLESLGRKIAVEDLAAEILFLPETD